MRYSSKWPIAKCGVFVEKWCLEGHAAGACVAGLAALWACDQDGVCSLVHAGVDPCNQAGPRSFDPHEAPAAALL